MISALTGPHVDAPTVALSLSLFWIVVGAALVIFMQAGFAMVETGFCRAKHAVHVVSTNFMIFGLGFVGFFFTGCAFMFGGCSYPGYFGFDTPVGAPLVSVGNWVFLWDGPFALKELGGPGTTASIAGVVVIEAVWFIESRLKIDDPVGANAVHGRCGLLGVLCVGIFSDGSYGTGWNLTASAVTDGKGVTDILYDSPPADEFSTM